MEEQGFLQPNGFAVLGEELWRRLKSPCRNVSFWTYLFIGIVFFCGLAVWFELWQIYVSPSATPKKENLIVALMTYFPALIGSVGTQMFFQEVGRNKRMMAFALIVLFLTFGIAFWLTFDKKLSDCFVLVASSFACVVSVVFWWIANGSDPAFQDDFLNQAALGGDTHVQPKGDLKNFKV